MEEPIPPGSRKPRRRLLRRLLWSLIALELLYLLAGNLFLLPEVGVPRINRKPEKFEVRWQRAWTFLPGLVHLRGLELTARAGRGSWHLEAEEVRARIALFDLPRRCFRLASARGSGLVFVAQLPPKASPGGEAFQPDLLDGSKPSESPAESRPAAATAPSGKKPWQIVLDDVRVRRVRSVDVGPYGYRGDGLLSGGMSAETRGGPLAVPGARLDLLPGQLSIGGEPAARLDFLKLELALDPAEKAERRGRRFLRFLSGRLEVASPEAQLSSLGFLFRRIPTMDLGGEGSGHLLVHLDHGVLQPGTTLYAQGDSAVDYLDYTVRGGGEIAGAVTEDEEGKAQAALDILFEDFELRQAGVEDPHVFGRGAAVQLTSRTLNLVELEPEVRALVEIPDSEVPRLAYYNRFLPADSGVRILGGRGRLSARMRLEAPVGTWAGELDLRGENLRVEFQERVVETQLHLEAKLPGGRIEERRADLSGTRLEINRARLLSKSGVPATEGWWARLELPEGEATLSDPVSLKTSFRADLKDTSPLLGLVRKDKASPPWLRQLITVEGVAGTGEILIEPHDVEARELAFTAGKHIEVQGHLRLAKKDLSALLFCRYRKLSAAVRMEHGERDWDLVGSRRWFHEQERAWLSSRPPPHSPAPP